MLSLHNPRNVMNYEFHLLPHDDEPNRTTSIEFIFINLYDNKYNAMLQLDEEGKFPRRLPMLLIH